MRIENLLQLEKIGIQISHISGEHCSANRSQKGALTTRAGSCSHLPALFMVLQQFNSLFRGRGLCTHVKQWHNLEIKPSPGLSVRISQSQAAWFKTRSSALSGRGHVMSRCHVLDDIQMTVHIVQMAVELQAV